jgi:DNA (cytosine-5)-methyltransferase 1
MNRPRLLDLYAGAGGAAVGYHRAGFDVVGVDLHPQPRYPFMFVQSDAIEFLRRNGRHFDAIHASPPCQDHSALKPTMQSAHGTAHLLAATRDLLVDLGLPYVIENVPGAPMVNPIVLCGSMFNLGAECRDGWRQLRRHRQFESGIAINPPFTCRHDAPAVGVYGTGGPAARAKEKGRRGGYQGLSTERVQAMGIDWMNRYELSQSIPPAYTEHIGAQLLATITERAVA